MPLAMHCKVTGLFLTTVFSGRSEDLIVGGTRLEEGRARMKTTTNDVTDLRVCGRNPCLNGKHKRTPVLYKENSGA